MLNPVTTGTAAVQIADSLLAAAHEKLIMFMLAVCALIVGMWGFNAFGLEAFNWVPFFAGGMIILIALTGPRKVLAAVGIGVVITGIAPTREAIMKGSLVGLKGLYVLILGTLLYFWMIAGFLATWSFQNRPAAFIPFAAGILMLVVLNAYFEKKSEKWTIRLVTAYSLFIIGIALWGTIADDAKELNPFAEKAPTAGTYEVTAQQFVGEANGLTFTIRDDVWSVFTWRDGYCVRQFGGVGLLEEGNDPKNTYKFLSPSGVQNVEVKLVGAGESWHGDVCQ